MAALFLCLGLVSTGWIYTFEYICSVWPVAMAKCTLQQQLNFAITAFHLI